MATNSASVENFCVYIRGRKPKPSRQDLFLEFQTFIWGWAGLGGFKSGYICTSGCFCAKFHLKLCSLVMRSEYSRDDEYCKLSGGVSDNTLFHVP